MNLWKQVLDRLEQNVERSDYESWLAPTRFLAHQGDTIEVSVPSQRFVSEIRQNYAQQIRNILDELSTDHLNLHLVADTEVVVDRKTHAIALTRTLAAPRKQVFEAWTRPEHVRCWWDPAGYPLAECEIDLRVGGAFRFVGGHSPSSAHEFAGVYLEITPPKQLVFEAMGAIGSVFLEERDGRTHLTVKIECRSAAHLEQYLKMGVDAGTAKTLDNLVSYVDATPG